MKTIYLLFSAAIAIVFETVSAWAEPDSSGNAIAGQAVQADSSAGLDVHVLPYAYYSNLLKYTLGGFVGVKGLVSENTLIKVGGIISTNNTLLGYLQVEDFQLPFWQRIFVKPDLLGGRIGTVKNYSVQLGTSTFGTNAGQNESSEDNYFEADGQYRWYEATFRFLLPIGWGAGNVVAHPKLRDGLLVSGETGGYNLNPFESGRTFLGTKVFYKNLKMTKGDTEVESVGAGWEFFLNFENLDYYWNPSVGYNLKLSYTTGSEMLSNSTPFDIWKGDLAWFVPLSGSGSLAPAVLALDATTIYTPSWNDFDLASVSVPGKGAIQYKKYHRPQNFVGAALGGQSRLRGYDEYRFFDCASVYYCAELRQILPWNPFNAWWLTRKVGVDWIQASAFAELGRVAPAWQLKELHSDMKWDVGAGLRLFMNGILLRIDVATGKEGTRLQMFYNYSF